MNKNKNKNIKSSQKEENVNVRRVRQLDETNTNKNNKKEKPSVVSRRAMMLDLSQYYNFYNNLSSNLINFTKQVLKTIPTSGIYKDVTTKVNLSSYPDNFEVTSYNDHVYAIKIKKEFEYEYPIKLTYEQIKVFQSNSTTENSTGFDMGLAAFREAKKKYDNDIANGKPWSVWYGADPVSKEQFTLDWFGVGNDYFDKKVSSTDGSLFTWEGKFVVKIDMNWNITLSFRTEDGWLPDNKQWIYGRLGIFRRGLRSTKTDIDLITSYTPPDVDGLQNEAEYTDEYNDTLRVIRRIPRVFCYGVQGRGCIDESVDYNKYWYNRGLPYYYGPANKGGIPNDVDYCGNSNGKGTNKSCLQGMARYVYISTKSNHNISDGTIYVSKSGAGNSMVDFDAHIVGYYNGQKQSDQDIKVEFSFNYLPKPEQTLLETKIVVCDPRTYTYTYFDPTRYGFYYPPRELEFNKKWEFDFGFGGLLGGGELKYETILNKLIVNDTNPYYGNSGDFMSIITNSTGPISFQLDNQSIYPEQPPFPFQSIEVKTYTDSYGDTYLSIIVNLPRMGILGYLREDEVYGNFRLKIIQGATSTYAEKVITPEFYWSIYSSYNKFPDTYIISFKRK